MKIIKLIACLLLWSQWLTAQTETGVMESSGKIYVVLATVLAIYVGIMIFLTIIERKLSNLERQIKE